ncbi:MAG: hypothetical protein GXP47_11215, partial [Acidobacteria bacterium]|nr:hypothetical protein [Acidobacteriota bacterium]
AVAARLEPLRPLFIVLTAAFLGFAFYQAYRKPSCAPGEACTAPANRTGQRIILWIMAIVSVLILGFPYFAIYLS